jgi:hypothetical protein
MALAQETCDESGDWDMEYRDGYYCEVKCPEMTEFIGKACEKEYIYCPADDGYAAISVPIRARLLSRSVVPFEGSTDSEGESPLPLSSVWRCS